MINPLCECPVAGYCQRHKVRKTIREHQLCRGQECSPAQSAKYWNAWEAGTMPGQSAPVADRKDFKEGLALPVVTGFNGESITSLPTGGVGTELKKLLSWFGQYAAEGCNCQKHADTMDANGIAWCETNVDQIIGWLSEEAAKRSVLGWSLDKVPGFEWTARQLVARAIDNAKAVEAARTKLLIYIPPTAHDPLTAIPAETNGRRNLAFHLWPRKPLWKAAADQLIKRLDVFNGVRSISVVVDHESDSLQDVKDYFAGHRIDHWLAMANDPKRRECVSFVPLLETMPRDTSITFWGHGKSVRHHEGSVCMDWAETQYRLLLDHMPTTDALTSQFPIVGAFKRLQFNFGPNCKYGWHYSGGVYWFRNADVFAKPDWQRLPVSFFAGTESWPGDMFPWANAACVGPSAVGDLYKNDEWDRIAPELACEFERRKE